MAAIWRTSVAVIGRTATDAGRNTVCTPGAMVSFMPADLHLVIEVGAVPQAPNHDGGPGLLRRRDGQIVVGGAVERAVGRGGDRGKHLFDHFQPFLGRKQRFFAGMDPDGDDQPVAQPDGVPDHIQMSIGDGVE